LDGLFLLTKNSNNRGDDDDEGMSLEEALLEAIQLIEEQSVDCLRQLQWWQSQYEPYRRTLENCINKLSAKDEEQIQQREYILNMLETAKSQLPSTQIPRTAAASASSPQNNNKNRNNLKPPPQPTTSSVDELERRIQQVKQILPHLGEGFIETALSLSKGDVESTVSMLLNDPTQYPTTLRLLDPSLPRRKKDYHSLTEDDDAKVARQLVKERVALDEEREQERYKALLYVSGQQDDIEDDVIARTHRDSKDIYDDDYDDQYDDVDVRLGSLDDGFTMDSDQVRLYNQVVREEESEDVFWEENRNTNRFPAAAAAAASKGNNDANADDSDGEGGDGGKQYRGPDKIRGGRVIGPDGKIVKKPGGGKTRNNNNKGGGGRGGGGNPNQNNNNNNNNKHQGRGGGGGRGGANGKNNNSANAGGQSNNNNNNNNQSGASSNNNTTGKPRTKPKADNRVNRQRDRKQKKQGAFGVQE
jgi:hypothetical protein